MRAYVGVGSNLGDRWGYLALAARDLRGSPRLAVVRASRVYETEPVGPPGQGRYLNAVLELDTTLPPRDLLRTLQRLEATARRSRSVRWGPRTLDLDLLLFGDIVLRAPELTLPHPALASRRFVLAPLAELCADAVIPGTNATVRELLARATPLDVTPVGLYPGISR